MLFTVCYAYLTFSTAWRDHRQKTKVMNALRCHGLKASIAFRKILQEGVASESDRCRASFLCEVGDQPIISQLLSEKRGKQMLIVHPKQRVDLSKDWTSFIGTVTSSVFPFKGPAPECPPPANPESVFVLLEASPPKVDRQGRLTLRKVSRERVVKLSGLTTPLAWKSGEPFGILVQASANNFGLVGSAYLEGVLELDDGLLVEQIVCVDTIGEPFSLVNQDPKTPSPSPYPPSSPFQRTPSRNNLPKSGTPQKELRPLRRKHSQEFFKKIEEQQRRLSRKSSSESSDLGTIPVDMESPGPDDGISDPTAQLKLGGGEVCDSKQGASGDASGAAVVKPPNILVYTGEDDSDGTYKTALAFLEKYVQWDRYVFYQLKQAHVLHHPWPENCKLLLVVNSGEALPEDVLNRFTRYVQAGGLLFALTGPPLKGASQAPPSVTPVTYSATLEDETIAFQGLCYGDTSAESWFAGGHVKVLADSQGSPVISETTFPDSSGKVVSSKIPLHVGSPESLVVDTEAFNKLKQSNEQRLKVIFDILEHLGLKCTTSELPALTCCYLLGVSEKASRGFLSSIQPYLKDGALQSRDLTMQFCTDPSKVKAAAPDFLPVVTGQTSVEGAPFNFDVYKKNLGSKTLGNLVLYTEVLPTTMVLFESFMFRVPEDISVVAIATRLTQGRGRGGNKWLGPIGCAMFSLHVRIQSGSVLADKLPFLQHIASVAVVEAVRSIDGYQDIDLRLKWPNDIYYGDKMKLGGVIVNSTFLNNMFHAIIGCGFNVDNSDPTICINDLIRLHNKQTGGNLPMLTTEQLLARAITEIERIISDFQCGRVASFLELYYKRWLHSGKKVRMENEDGPEVSVEGLDKAGFLLVKDQQGLLHSVQPDGNSFDMTKNLVHLKERMK